MQEILGRPLLECATASATHAPAGRAAGETAATAPGAVTAAARGHEGPLGAGGASAETLVEATEVEAAAGRVPPGVHQRTRLLKITGIPHGPLLTLGRGRLTPQPGKENLVRGACDISRRRSVHTPNLPMPTRARTTGN